MKHHRYGVKEAVVALMLEDNPASQSGVVNGIWLPYGGLQIFGYQVTAQEEKLYTEGVIRAREGSIDDLPVNLEYGQFTPDIEALLTDSACWYDADGNQHFAITEDFGNAYCSIRCRVDKVGRQGYDVVYEVPKIKVSALDRSGTQRQFAPNKFTVGASFTDATYPVYKDGSKVFRSRAVLETLRPAGAPLYTLSPTPPSVVSVNGSPSGDVAVELAGVTFAVLFANPVNPNSVNDLTLLLTSAGEPVPATVTPTLTGENAYKLFTLAPTADLTAGTYGLKLLTVCRSRDGVQLATEYNRVVIATAP